ncbi:MAG: RnfABCDGE type electron transport complex subunit B [Burkholderiaceae bacterium]|nr:RnfABCDGE type electron transport complex subunit B [Burkholderiaceae bacterium]
MNPRNDRRLARIDPHRCIGCTRCIEACPFDAIIGAPQRMHTVIEAACIGCELCVPPCPVDCIALVVVDPPSPLARATAIDARARRERRRARLAREAQAPAAAAIDRHAIVAAALHRAQAFERTTQARAGEAPDP